MWRQLVIILLSLTNIAYSEVYLMKTDYNITGSTELGCFYNGPQTESVGLSWILPSTIRYIQETTERWRHTSRPGLIKGHFEYFGHIWKSTTALTMPPPNIFPPVIDERWNNFPTIVTDGGTIFSTPESFSTDRIHISILAKSDVHIALHVDTSPYHSSTYWISLDQTDSAVMKSALRKCPRGIPRSLLPRSDDCKIIRAGHVGLPMLDNGEEWTHFTITLTRISNVMLRIKLVSTNTRDLSLKGLSPLSWDDMDSPFIPKFISFRSDKTIARFKIHNYRLIYHNGNGDGEAMNVFQLTHNYKTCLQLFYYFKQGYGKAVIESANNQDSMELSHTNGKWNYLKVELDLVAPKDHIHFKAPNVSSIDKTGPIFAISNPFRICGENEFLISKIVGPTDRLQNARCIDLKSFEGVMYRNDISRAPIHNCAKDYFGVKCNITCGKAVGDSTCRGKVICDRNLCSCVSGYKYSNSSCYEEEATDVVTLKSNTTTPTSAPQEEDTVTEEAVDVDIGEDGSGYIDIEKAERIGCKMNNGNNTKNIVIVILTILLVIALVGGVWIWVKRNTYFHGDTFSFFWKNKTEDSVLSRNLVHNDEDVDA